MNHPKLTDADRTHTDREPEAKTHPCLVPYDQLPPEQKAKDRIFVSTVKAVLAAGGFL